MNSNPAITLVQRVSAPLDVLDFHPSIFYEVCSNKVIYSPDSCNILASVDFHHHPGVASDVCHNFYNQYFQLVLSQYIFNIITYMFYHVYVTTHICDLTYTNNMNQEPNTKKYWITSIQFDQLESIVGDVNPVNVKNEMATLVGNIASQTIEEDQS